jgi:hypothetical protein
VSAAPSPTVRNADAASPIHVFHHPHDGKDTAVRLSWREQYENLPITPAPNTHSCQDQAANTSFRELFLAAFEKSRLEAGGI